jgi:cbb3-type cytochrome oxidase subunit 3
MFDNKVSDKGGNMKVRGISTMALATVVVLCLLLVLVYLYKVSNRKSVQNKEQTPQGMTESISATVSNVEEGKINEILTH